MNDMIGGDDANIWGGEFDFLILLGGIIALLFIYARVVLDPPVLSLPVGRPLLIGPS